MFLFFFLLLFASCPGHLQVTLYAGHRDVKLFQPPHDINMKLSFNFSAEIGMCLTFPFIFSLILNIPNTVPEVKSKVNIILMGLMYGQSLHFFFPLEEHLTLFLLNRVSSNMLPAHSSENKSQPDHTKLD